MAVSLESNTPLGTISLQVSHKLWLAEHLGLDLWHGRRVPKDEGLQKATHQASHDQVGERALS